ncbi:MAG: hypothetical protein HY791_34900 [Deltaproteobacteria bacterium]|nr:hypothetical protein [Deltaproteobacteria bacterium]
MMVVLAGPAALLWLRPPEQLHAAFPQLSDFLGLLDVLMLTWSALAGGLASSQLHPSFTETLPGARLRVAFGRLSVAALPILLVECSWIAVATEHEMRRFAVFGAFSFATFGTFAGARALSRRDGVSYLALYLILMTSAVALIFMRTVWGIVPSDWLAFRLLAGLGLVGLATSLVMATTPLRLRRRVVAATLGGAVLTMAGLLTFLCKLAVDSPPSRWRVKRVAPGQALVLAGHSLTEKYVSGPDRAASGVHVTHVDAVTGRCAALGRSSWLAPGRFQRLDHRQGALFASPRMVDTWTGADADISALVGRHASEVVSLSTNELGATSTAAWTVAHVERSHSPRLAGFRRGQLLFEETRKHAHVEIREGAQLLVVTSAGRIEAGGWTWWPAHAVRPWEEETHFLSIQPTGGVWLHDLETKNRTELLSAREWACQSPSGLACSALGRPLPEGRRSLPRAKQQFSLARGRRGEVVAWLRVLDVGERRKVDLLRFELERSVWVPIATDLFEGSVFQDDSFGLRAGPEHELVVALPEMTELVVDVDTSARRDPRPFFHWSPNHAWVVALDRSIPRLGRSEKTLVPTRSDPRLESGANFTWVDDERLVAVSSGAIWILETSTGSWRRCEWKR